MIEKIGKYIDQRVDVFFALQLATNYTIVYLLSTIMNSESLLQRLLFMAAINMLAVWQAQKKSSEESLDITQVEVEDEQRNS